MEGVMIRIVRGRGSFVESSAREMVGGCIESGAMMNLGRTELGVGSAFSLCSARCGVAACLPGLCATGEGTALLPFGASTEPARGERRVGIPPAISELPRALRAD